MSLVVCGSDVLSSVLIVYLFFFFKQKTAYEVRISDWSSDVCSSDLLKLITGGLRVGVSAPLAKTALAQLGDVSLEEIEELWHGMAPPFQPLFAWLEGH